MRTVTLDLAPVAASSTGLASNVSSAGTSVALTGALTSGGVFTSSDGMGRIISIADSSTSTQSDVTFTIIGTDTNGDAITDTITGPASGATVVSTKAFLTVSSITISAAQGGSEAVNVGIVGTTLSAISKIVPLNFYNEVAPEVSVDVTGTINFTVQQTFDSILTVKDSSGNISWEDITALTSKTADTLAQTSIGAKAIRVKINSYSSSATAQVAIISSQNDLLDPINNIGTAVTVAGADKVVIQDVSDGDRLKTVTAQSIADLGGGGGVSDGDKGDVVVSSNATVWTVDPVTGTGNFVKATSPTLVTPALGTIASGNLSAGTGSLVNLTTVTTSADVTFNGITVGKGNSSVATNLAIGNASGDAITSGARLVSLGNSALTTATTFTDSVAVGYEALKSASTGAGESVAVGSQALSTANTAVRNTAVGMHSLKTVAGSSNTGCGAYTLYQGTTCTNTVALGNLAFGSVTSAIENVVVGASAMTFVTTGGGNVGVGFGAGTITLGATGEANLTTGQKNTLVGSYAATSSASASNCIALGSGAVANAATGATSSDDGAGIAIGSVECPVGFRGDATIYPAAGASAGYMLLKINGTEYKIQLYAKT